jgi:hypothetical protein
MCGLHLILSICIWMIFQKACRDMIAEENDMTQEIRQLVILQTKSEIDMAVKRIEEAKIPVKDEWSEGLNMGMDWAIRILKKDKGAS